MRLTEPFDFRFSQEAMLEDYRQLSLAHAQRQLALDGEEATVDLRLSGKAFGMLAYRMLWPDGPIGTVQEAPVDEPGVIVRFPAAEILEALRTATPTEMARLNGHYGKSKGLPCRRKRSA